jgi:hypothetical protein
VQQFFEAGSTEKGKSPRKSSTMAGSIERIRHVFLQSSKESTLWESKELQIPRNMIYDVLHKCLRLCRYKMQLMQQIKPADHKKHMNFAARFL